MWRLASAVYTALFLSKKPLRSAALVGGAIFSLEVVALLVAAYLDGNYFLVGNDLGLFEHFGIWIITLGDWLILLAIAAIVVQARRIPSRFPLKPGKVTRRFARLTMTRLLGSMSLARRDRVLFLYFVLAGLAFWANNAVQTRYPQYYYGNDLFDSINFIHGYYVTRVLLFFSWVVFIPYIAFVTICVAATIFKSVSTTAKHGLLDFKPLHPDGCGGFSFFGNLNLVFILGILVIYSELIVVLLTHDQLNPGLLSGFVIITVVFLGLSYVTLVPVFLFLGRERRRHALRNYAIASRQDVTLDGIAHFLFSRESSFSPYNALQRVAVNVARFVPIVVSGIRIYQLANGPVP